MTMYVYHADGHPVGFLHSNYIHDLEGHPLGRVVGTRVHRFDGSYVGEFFKQTVVNKPVTTRRNMGAIKPPPEQQPPETTCARRGVVDYGFVDVFAHLYRSPERSADAEHWPIAAE